MSRLTTKKVSKKSNDAYIVLKSALFARKVTYSKAAKAIGISTTAFNNKINAISDFTIREIKKLGTEFDFDPTIIFNEEL